MKRYEIHLCQDKGVYSCLANVRPDKVIECSFNTNKEVIHYTLDKLLEAPKKYEYAVLFNSKGDSLIFIQR